MALMPGEWILNCTGESNTSIAFSYDLGEYYTMDDCTMPTCDVNVFNGENEELTDNQVVAQHAIMRRGAQLNDKIAQHELAIVVLRAQLKRLYDQANQHVPIPVDPS